LKPRCCWVAMVARCRKQDAKSPSAPAPNAPPTPATPSNEPQTRRPRLGCSGAYPGRASPPPRGHARACFATYVYAPRGPPPTCGQRSNRREQKGAAAGREHSPCVSRARIPWALCTHGQVGDKRLSITQHGGRGLCTVERGG
jgi:hypothetical protein